MTPQLLLALVLWAGCPPCSGRKGPPAALTLPRVQCRAPRYPIAVDCSWTLPPAPNSTSPVSFIATYRLGMAARGHSWPCLQQTPASTSCTITDVQLFSMAPYVLNVTAVHPWGSSSSFVPFIAEHILKYWIRYKRQGAARFHQVGPIEATSFILKAVRPRARYYVQVAAQDLTDYGELSDWSLPVTAVMSLGK
uniref:Epstein-Barr virus induced 3 n=1 Tax=Nomascus leucogenys TaxID=61853 RepID=G1QS35_NOMLE